AAGRNRAGRKQGGRGGEVACASERTRKREERRYEPAAPPGIRMPPAWRLPPGRLHAARRRKARLAADGDRWRRGRTEWRKRREPLPISAINGAIPPPRQPGYAQQMGQSVGSLAQSLAA